MRNILVMFCVALGFAVLFVLNRPQPIALMAPSPPPQPQDQARLTAIHDAGCRGDRSVLSDISIILQHPSPIPKDIGTFYQIDPLYTHTALRAATQLHAIEVMPQIEALISSKDPDASALARVTKARILAEVAAQNTADPKAQAAVKVGKFFDVLGMTSDDVNSQLTVYNKPLLNASKHEIISPGWEPPVPVGVYAMREVADMLYQGDYRNYVSLPNVTALHFSEDGFSMLKRRFARVTPADRIAALVADLSHRDPHGEYDAQENYVMQLAIDEGQAAAQAATGTLQQMETHPDEYPMHGFYNMIDLIGYTGNRTQAAQLEKLHDRRRMVIARVQFAAQDIAYSRHKLFVPGY